jgi:hypothetical protein
MNPKKAELGSHAASNVDVEKSMARGRKRALLLCRSLEPSERT